MTIFTTGAQANIMLKESLKLNFVPDIISLEEKAFGGRIFSGKYFKKGLDALMSEGFVRNSACAVSTMNYDIAMQREKSKREEDHAVFRSAGYEMIGCAVNGYLNSPDDDFIVEAQISQNLAGIHFEYHF